MATKEEILDSIAGLTVLELSELLKEFEEKFGVTAAAPVAQFVGPGAGSAPVEAEAEQDEFDVVLTAAGDKKIQVRISVRGYGRRRYRAGPWPTRSLTSTCSGSVTTWR
jgi:large subunit ribosomal protein L7/L12